MTLFRRVDEGVWHLPTVGGLRDILNRSEMPSDWELIPNDYGNLAVYRPVYDDDQYLGTDPPNRYYIGYIDLHQGEVHMAPQGPVAVLNRDAPGFDTQRMLNSCPNCGAIVGQAQGYRSTNGLEEQSDVGIGWGPDDV